jgi:hypothetical protein
MRVVSGGAGRWLLGGYNCATFLYINAVECPAACDWLLFEFTFFDE